MDTVSKFVGRATVWIVFGPFLVVAAFCFVALAYRQQPLWALGLVPVSVLGWKLIASSAIKYRPYAATSIEPVYQGGVLTDEFCKGLLSIPKTVGWPLLVGLWWCVRYGFMFLSLYLALTTFGLVGAVIGLLVVVIWQLQSIHARMVEKAGEERS